MGKDRVQRIWRREGLKVPAKQKPRGRLWLNDGSCVRLRPTHRNHVWSYDFVEARTHDGRSLRLLVMIDEYTRECLAIRVARRLNSAHVIELLGDCMLEHGVPEHVRSDNGAEMTARRVKSWLAVGGDAAVIHRAGESVGERILRIVQWEAAGRVFERRDFLFAQRGASGDQRVAEVLQHTTSPQRIRLSPAGSGKLDRGGMNRALRKSPFACRMFSKAGCGRGQGSAMNSLRSALTAVLAGLSDSKMQAKGDTEPRHCRVGYTLYRTGTKYRSGQSASSISRPISADALKSSHVA